MEATRASFADTQGRRIEGRETPPSQSLRRVTDIAVVAAPPLALSFLSCSIVLVCGNTFRLVPMWSFYGPSRIRLCFEAATMNHVETSRGRSTRHTCVPHSRAPRGEGGGGRERGVGIQKAAPMRLQATVHVQWRLQRRVTKKRESRARRRDAGNGVCLCAVSRHKCMENFAGSVAFGEESSKT